MPSPFPPPLPHWSLSISTLRRRSPSPFVPTPCGPITLSPGCNQHLSLLHQRVNQTTIHIPFHPIHPSTHPPFPSILPSTSPTESRYSPPKARSLAAHLLVWLDPTSGPASIGTRRESLLAVGRAKGDRNAPPFPIPIKDIHLTFFPQPKPCPMTPRRLPPSRRRRRA